MELGGGQSEALWNFRGEAAMGYHVSMAHGKLGGSGGIFPEKIFEYSNYLKSLLGHFQTTDVVSISTLQLHEKLAILFL